MGHMVIKVTRNLVEAKLKISNILGDKICPAKRLSIEKIIDDLVLQSITDTLHHKKVTSDVVEETIIEMKIGECVCKGFYKPSWCPVHGTGKG